MSAATLDFGEPWVASPELALVDETLAAELRRSLPDPTPPLRADVPVPPALPVDEEDECSDLIVGYADEPPIDVPNVVEPTPPPLEIEMEGNLGHVVGHEDAESGSCLDLIVGYGGASADAEPPVSAYPSLPAPDAQFDTTEETETALRRIQERLTVEPTPSRTRRLRRRFTVASGVVAGASLVVYAVQVYSGVAQLPGLPA